MNSSCKKKKKQNYLCPFSPPINQLSSPFRRNYLSGYWQHLSVGRAKPQSPTTARFGSDVPNVGGLIRQGGARWNHATGGGNGLGEGLSTSPPPPGAQMIGDAPLRAQKKGKKKKICVSLVSSYY